MIEFLTMEQESALYKFVRVDLSNKYQMPIDIEEAEIVVGMEGAFGGETIEEALKVRFFPKDAHVQWIENKIRADIHEFCYLNDIRITPSIVIEKDVWLGEIRYGLVYMNAQH